MLPGQEQSSLGSPNLLVRITSILGAPRNPITTPYSGAISSMLIMLYVNPVTISMSGMLRPHGYRVAIVRGSSYAPIP